MRGYEITIAKLKRQVAILQQQVDEARQRLRGAELILRHQVEEVHNHIGGVIGYRLSLDEDHTKAMWDLLAGRDP